MLQRTHTLIAAACLLSASCATETESGPGVGDVTLGSAQFEVLAQFPHPDGRMWNALDAGNLVIAEGQEWHELWEDLVGVWDGARPLPHVDFAQECVVIVSLGERPTSGYTMEVAGVWSDGEQLRMEVIETAPGDGCDVMDTAATAAVVVRVPKFTGSLNVELSRRVRNCR